MIYLAYVIPGPFFVLNEEFCERDQLKQWRPLILGAICAGFHTMSEHAIPILYSPAMLPGKPAKQPKKSRARFTYGAALNPEMATKVDKLVAQSGGTISDVIRTALIRLFASTDDLNPLIDPAGASAVSQPQLAARYTGSGGSDQTALRAAAKRQASLPAEGRLVDKAPSR